MANNNTAIGTLIISIIVLILVIVIFIVFISKCNNQQQQQQLNSKAVLGAVAIKKNKSNFIDMMLTANGPSNIMGFCPYGSTTYNGWCSLSLAVNPQMQFINPNLFSSCPYGSTTFGNCKNPMSSYLLPLNNAPYTATIYSVY